MEVLVIDDEVVLAQALAESLESRGFAVALCHDGHTGYRRAKELDVDVIVLDLMLPGISGGEVCTRLRAEGVWTPILVLTAREAEAVETEVLNLGPTTTSASPSPTKSSWPGAAHWPGGPPRVRRPRSSSATWCSIRAGGRSDSARRRSSSRDASSPSSST